MIKKLYIILLLLMIVVGHSVIYAAIKLPAVLSDNMVLQRNTAVLLWGNADPDTQISVETSWNGTKYTTRSEADGAWRLKVKTAEAGGPYTVTIKSTTQVLSLKNVMLGEVWLCGGQSNMDMSFRGLTNQPLDNAADEILNSNYPQLRFFRVKRDFNLTPQSDCRGSWTPSNSATAETFSAVGFLFGRMLHLREGVPVGMIACAWGGSKVEAWMSRELLEQFAGAKVEWEVDAANANRTPSALYNAMLLPIAGYTIKGCIFYQGEANVTNPTRYAQLFPAMVMEWRKLWQDNFPFYYAQLAPFNYANMGWNSDGVEVAKFREVQQNSMSDVSNSGMVTLTDIGNEYCIHPSDKVTVAKRFLYWAYANAYGYKGFEWCGPTFKAVTYAGGKAVVSFDNARYGVSSYSKPLIGFEIAGADKLFYPAQATIVKGVPQVEISSDKVSQPVAVRYCFKNYAYGNLYNNYGVAAPPFRTDNW